MVISPRALAEIGTYYSYEELVSGVPPGVDSARKEEYLDPATFKAKFGVDKVMSVLAVEKYSALTVGVSCFGIICVHA